MVSKYPGLLVIPIVWMTFFIAAHIGLGGNQEVNDADDIIQSLQSKNNAPTVNVTEPKNNSIHPLNSLVPYAISVSDREDGESRFDEIPLGKIFLEIRFVPVGQTPDQYAYESEPSGLRYIKNSGCFSCHQFKTRFTGPSFMEIAARYSADSRSQRNILAARITGGTSNVWGSSVMPGHPHISLKESQEIVDWILDSGLNKNLDYMTGKEGSFRIAPPAGEGEGFFLLTATYSDSGAPGKPEESLTGRDAVVIHIK